MDVETARVGQGILNRGDRQEMMEMGGELQEVFVSAFLDILPECKFNYQMPDGTIEQRVNMRLLSWAEIVDRIISLPASQRRGRVRKDV